MFSVLPELRARVNLTLPEHVFWREGMLRSESCNDQISHGHPFEFRPRYRVGISNTGGNRINWRYPLNKGSVVRASFVFHQKAREMGCYELCEQRSVWRGRCERVWRSGYKIGRGKFIPWSKFHVPDQDEVPTLECSAASENIKANFVPIKPRRAEVAKTSQKHQDSTDEGTDDSSEESRDSTTKNIFFCSEEGCIKSYQRHSSLQKHLECGRHKYVLEYETLYDRAVLGYASRLEKGPSAVPQLLDTESTRHRL